MRKTLLLICLFIGNYALGQITYIYSGTGTWNDYENWNLHPDNMHSEDSVIITNGSSLTLVPGHQNYATFTNNGTLNIPEDGELSNNNGGLINNAGIINNYGRINNVSGTFNNLTTGIVNIENDSDFYNQNNPRTILNNNGTINISGIIYNFTNKTINNDGNIVIEVSGSITNNGIVNNNSDGILTNNGLISHDSNNIFNFGVINNNGSIDISNSSSFTNEVSGVVNNLINGYITNGPSATFVNHGNIENIGLFSDNSFSDSTVSTANYGTINNSGEIRTSYYSIFSNEANGIINNSAQFTYTGNSINAGVINNNSTGTIENNRLFDNNNQGVINNDGLVDNTYFGTINNTNSGIFNNNASGSVLNTGEFSGVLSSWGDLRGTNILHAVNFVSNGSVSPGDISLIGLYQFTDDYSQNTDAELNIEIESELIFDKISVGGDCNLDGTLHVTLLNEFDPVVGDTFTIITANEIFASFSTLDLPILIDKEWVVTYNSDSVVLSIENSLSIEDQENINNIELFPNPVKNHLIVDSKKIINLIEIYDLSGRLVEAINYDGVYYLNLDVSGLENGLYFININNFNYKFIKK